MFTLFGSEERPVGKRERFDDIQRDRYKQTVYQKQMKSLTENDGVYETVTPCIQDVYNLEAQVRLGKESIDKVSKDVCTEPEKMEETHDTVISLILNNKSEVPIFGNQVEEWIRLFPAVDVMQELRKMRSWLRFMGTIQSDGL